MNSNAIGLWYVKIPNRIVYDPTGKEVQPKLHNGSICVLINRKRVPVSKLSEITEDDIVRFKEIFY